MFLVRTPTSALMSTPSITSPTWGNWGFSVQQEIPKQEEKKKRHHWLKPESTYTNKKDNRSNKTYAFLFLNKLVSLSFSYGRCIFHFNKKSILQKINVLFASASYSFDPIVCEQNGKKREEFINSMYQTFSETQMQTCFKRKKYWLFNLFQRQIRNWKWSQNTVWKCCIDLFLKEKRTCFPN